MAKFPVGTLYFPNGTQTGPVPVAKLIVPSINPSTPVLVYAIIVRPEEGGSEHLLHFCTADGIFHTVDIAAEFGIVDSFGATAVLSDFTGTIKAMVNAKQPDTANGNDRVIFPVDSGVPASEPYN